MMGQKELLPGERRAIAVLKEIRDIGVQQRVQSGLRRRNGAGTADFCVMNGRLPTEDDQRTLPQAGDFIDEQLTRLVRDRYFEAIAATWDLVDDLPDRFHDRTAPVTPWGAADSVVAEHR